jgi:hypothetical protein
MDVAKQTFGSKLQQILDEVQKQTNIGKRVIEDSVKISTRLAVRVANITCPYFVEIGCGAVAIPSLALASLGYQEYLAFDKHHSAIGAGLMAWRTGVHPNPGMNYDVFDFYEWNPQELPQGTFFIAERPKGGYEHPTFEQDIIHAAVRKGCNLALLPAIDDESLDTVAACDKHKAILDRQGYNTEVYELLPGCRETHAIIAYLK